MHCLCDRSLAKFSSNLVPLQHRHCLLRQPQAPRQQRSCRSSSIGGGSSPGAPDDLWRQQQPQQPQPPQQQQQQPWSNQAAMTAQLTPSLQQEFRQQRPLPGWLPPWLLVHGESLLAFLRACWQLLPEFVSPSLGEAVRRLVLVLGVSLVMVGVVCTIDSGWLCLHLISTRRLPAVA